MPWIAYPDVDDTIHDWLKSIYTTYRNSLVDPSVLPLETDIDWDTYWAGFNPMSFMVYEAQTTHQNLGLGVKTIDFIGIQVIRVTYRFINAGKPPELKRMREFVTRKLQENISPLPTALSSAGIVQMVPLESTMIMERNQSGQQDFWTLEVRIQTKVLNSIV